ncbi:MAG: (d)CMP kinase [Oscillospiraceae bacterium]|nr:(d)CMP kinase [Oscillospiraceae bacterium]
MIVAIDGPAASGKSTLAEAAARKYGYTVIHMDDFFDDNITRFHDEVIVPLLRGSPFTYRAYDCGSGTYTAKTIADCELVLIEGVYSMRFAEYYDFKIFIQVQKNEQMRRLQARRPDLVQMFVNEWLPAEEKYFSEYNVVELCDYVYD